MKWNESGFRSPLCTYRLNWARRTSWGWWDDWDDTVLQTQDSKFEPWRAEAEHATSRSRRLPTILTFTRGLLYSKRDDVIYLRIMCLFPMTCLVVGRFGQVHLLYAQAGLHTIFNGHGYKLLFLQNSYNAMFQLCLLGYCHHFSSLETLEMSWYVNVWPSKQDKLAHGWHKSKTHRTRATRVTRHATHA